jgi:hypothetical protein
MHQGPKFSSFVMGGFECTYSLNEHHERLDLLASTRHDVLCREDYRLLKSIGISTVREGFAWQKIDKGNGVYDFSRFEEMIAIGKEEKIQQIWDLNHFDFPNDLDIFSDDFVERFAEYSKHIIKLLRKYTDEQLYICPVNEISFFAFIGGDAGAWAPHQIGRGIELKKQLVKASIAAMDAIWEIDRNVRFIQVDPIFYRTPKKPITKAKIKVAREFIDGKFQAWDMLSGVINPELGGHPKYLDILGCNYYYYNQEWITSVGENDTATYETIPLYSKHRITLGTMLKQVYLRYKRPMIVSETGGWGELRPKWWRKIFNELDRARRRLPIYGVCVYPVIDRPDWNDGHLTNSGLWDFEFGDKTCCRIPHVDTINLVQKYTQREQIPLEIKPLAYQL